MPPSDLLAHLQSEAIANSVEPSAFDDFASEDEREDSINTGEIASSKKNKKKKKKKSANVGVNSGVNNDSQINNGI